ncbi:hypothetical protein KBY93_15360 [Synechococcus sp. J7-Johnson]|nr:hypothetical protein [Synechococcus sp. J7-Johnson]
MPLLASEATEAQISIKNATSDAMTGVKLVLIASSSPSAKSSSAAALGNIAAGQQVQRRLPSGSAIEQFQVQYRRVNMRTPKVVALSNLEIMSS